MKYILLFSIRCYWYLIPAESRNTCLFAESCSNHVYKITKQKGLWRGLKAFWGRYKKCRPGYKLEVSKETGKELIILADLTTLEKKDASEFLINEFNSMKKQ